MSVQCACITLALVRCQCHPRGKERRWVSN